MQSWCTVTIEFSLFCVYTVLQFYTLYRSVMIYYSSILICVVQLRISRWQCDSVTTYEKYLSTEIQLLIIMTNHCYLAKEGQLYLHY